VNDRMKTVAAAAAPAVRRSRVARAREARQLVKKVAGTSIVTKFRYVVRLILLFVFV
jgi:hypothetical protein